MLIFIKVKLEFQGKLIVLKIVIIKLISTKNDKIQTSELNPNDFSFKFDNILSGQYKLLLLNLNGVGKMKILLLKFKILILKILILNKMVIHFFINHNMMLKFNG